MKIVYVKSILMILVLCTTSQSFASPCTAHIKDFWLKAERTKTGQSYINMHFTIRQLENGNFEYKVDIHGKIGDIWSGTEDITQKGTYLVDSNLAPVSFEVHFKSRIKDTHLRGQYSDGMMNLIIEDKNSQVQKNKIPFRDTFFDVVLADLILKREKEKLFNLKIFDPTGLMTQRPPGNTKVQIEVTKSDLNELEANVTNVLTQKYLLNRQGEIKQIKFIGQNVRAYLTDAVDAQDISYLNIGLMKSKKFFPNVAEVRHATIEVEWKDIPFEEFDFIDNRQKVVKKTLTKNEHEIVLEFTKITPASKGTKASIADNKFTPFLKNSDYIRPSDPAIQQQIAEIKSDEEDAAVIVENILRWISSNITFKFVAQHLTGPEVLKEKTGQCMDYSALFASLARAGGIPTRVVVGYVNTRVDRHGWGTHMWNEVWVDGNWLALDATRGVFITGPSHVKFSDNSSVTEALLSHGKLENVYSLEVLSFTKE